MNAQTMSGSLLEGAAARALVLALALFGSGASMASPGDAAPETRSARLAAAVEASHPGCALPAADAATHRVDGDFDGDGRTDTVLLLGCSGEWRIVAFRDVQDTGFVSQDLGGFPGSDSAFRKNQPAGQVGLRLIPAGQALTLMGQAAAGTEHDLDHLAIDLPESVSGTVHVRWDGASQSFFDVTHLLEDDDHH